VVNSGHLVAIRRKVVIGMTQQIPPEVVFLRLQEVLRIIPVSKATLRRWIESGHFPVGRKLSPQVTVWLAEEVYAWIARHTCGNEEQP
jgi:predicted DNA-binding transcriptional regulator AlpA